MLTGLVAKCSKYGKCFLDSSEWFSTTGTLTCIAHFPRTLVNSWTSPEYKTECCRQQFPNLCMNFFPDIWACPFQECCWFFYQRQLSFFPSVNSMNTMVDEELKMAPSFQEFSTAWPTIIRCIVHYYNQLSIFKWML